MRLIGGDDALGAGRPRPKPGVPSSRRAVCPRDLCQAPPRCVRPGPAPFWPALLAPGDRHRQAEPGQELGGEGRPESRRSVAPGPGL